MTDVPRSHQQHGTLRDCVIALNIWFYEVAVIGKKTQFRRSPRILCYGENSLKKPSGVGIFLETLAGKEISILIAYYEHVMFLNIVIF